MSKFTFLIGAAISLSTSLNLACEDIERIKSRGVLIAGVKTDMEKFSYKDPKTDIIDGFEIDIARAIAKKILGDANKLKLVPITTQSREYLLYSGKLDIIAATFTITEQREQFYNFSSPYYTDGLALVVRKDSDIKSLKSLNGKSIGTVYGTTSRAVLREVAAQNGMKLKFFSFGAYSEIKSALSSSMVDCFVADRSILSQYADDSMMILDDIISIENYGIASLKSDTQLGEIVNEVIDELKSSGELSKLAKKWNLE
ncbi:MAG: transporter substrate-binding domain-containing protein [Campylobacteraceae bacterium]|jgi:putative glutamine transport system substrate-binding protein|nr:transporter substrate-binding domain-containing protein [Campylobacteraceae bacterium]